MAEKSQYRLEVLKRIEEFEIAERWHDAVENDPPTIELLPNKVDYLNKKLSSKIATAFVNHAGNKMIDKLIKEKQLIVEDVVGIENFDKIEGGCIITCNHFHPFDNFAVWKVIKSHMKGHLWKVIREGNYTNPPAPFGKFFKHCNTLPLSQNRKTMMNFLSAVDTLLSRGEKILIYPEQNMWWNYRKPRPMQDGAFKLAVKSDVPVLPVFITMRDSDILDGEGFAVQKYTIHFLPAIYPDKNLSRNQKIEDLKEKNFNLWKETYEKFYDQKLVYKKGN